jgi:hypothetical protein
LLRFVDLAHLRTTTATIVPTAERSWAGERAGDCVVANAIVAAKRVLEQSNREEDRNRRQEMG